MKNVKRLSVAIVMLLVSAILLSTASFAWFSMNTNVLTTGIELEVYSDSLYLTVSQRQDTGYAFTTEFTDTNKAVRLCSLRNLGNETVYTVAPTKVAQGSRYNPSSTVKYYELVVGTDSNDSYDTVGSYRLVEFTETDAASSLEGYYSEENVDITIIKSSATYTSGTYYKKVGNAYERQTLTAGDELYGLYTIGLTSPEGADSRYTGSGIYYKLENGNVYPVGGLKLGTLIDSYYTLVPTEVSTPVIDTDYYIASGDDYVCIGKLDMQNTVGGADAKYAEGGALEDTIVADDYYFFARAYSDSNTDAQADAAVSVIKHDKYSHDENPYYLYETVYLRMDEGANAGENLRVREINVHGTDSVSDALRILLVAKNGRGQVARATYNNRTGELVHIDASDADGEGILFSSILGDRNEVVEVQIFVYYEGTDASAKTEDHYMLGQSIDIQFSIDVPDYLQQ